MKFSSGGGDAPFEETYEDFLAFLNVVAGVNVDEGLARFKMKAEREAAEGASYASQIYVNLLLRIDRVPEALAAPSDGCGAVSAAMAGADGASVGPGAGGSIGKRGSTVYLTCRGFGVAV